MKEVEVQELKPMVGAPHHGNLADLFHNAVLEMENAAQGKTTYDEVLRLLEESAKEKNCEKWLAAAFKDLEPSQPTSPTAG